MNGPTKYGVNSKYSVQLESGAIVQQWNGCVFDGLSGSTFQMPFGHMPVWPGQTAE